jgi:Protein of unknown function (DUF1499)
MRSVRPALILSLVVASAAAAFVLAVRNYMGRPSQDRLAPEEQVSIAALRPPLPPPSFLACPPDYCTAGVAGISSPIFALPWDRLRDDWAKMIGGELRVVRVSAEQQGRRLTYIQHPFLFRFPDVVTVEFVPLGPESSSIALYSRSRYGHYDFHQNRRRVETWLSMLERLADPAGSPPPIR